MGMWEVSHTNGSYVTTVWAASSEEAKAIVRLMYLLGDNLPLIAQGGRA